MSSPFVTEPGVPAWQQPVPPPERPYMPGGIASVSAVAVDRVLQGVPLGPWRKDALCTLHFPGGPELTRLAMAARQGKPAAFVGTGHEHTPLTCACLADGDLPWRLGDHLVHLSGSCLAGRHAECRDKACGCECQGLDARGAIESSENDRALAEVLRDIHGTLKGDIPAAVPGELMAEIARLRARNAELEAAQPAQCTGTTVRGGERCKANALDGSDRCAKHPRE